MSMPRHRTSSQPSEDVKSPLSHTRKNTEGSPFQAIAVKRNTGTIRPLDRNRNDTRPDFLGRCFDLPTAEYLPVMMRPNGIRRQKANGRRWFVGSWTSWKRANWEVVLPLVLKNNRLIVAVKVLAFEWSSPVVSNYWKVSHILLRFDLMWTDFI